MEELPKMQPIELPFDLSEVASAMLASRFTVSVMALFVGMFVIRLFGWRVWRIVRLYFGFGDSI